MEKEFTRYKAQSKEEIDRNEKTMEEMEGKISEVRVVQLRSMDVHFLQCDFSQGRRNAESWKRKHDSVQVGAGAAGTKI